MFLIGGGMIQGLDHGPQAQGEVHAIGVLMQFASMLCSSQRWALMQFVLLPLVHVLEPDALKPDNLLQAELLIHVFIIAAALTLMVYSEVQLVQLLSAVAFNVLAAIHQIPLVLVGVLLQHDHVSQTAACGFRCACLSRGLCAGTAGRATAQYRCQD